MTANATSTPERKGDIITLPKQVEDLTEATKMAKPLLKKDEVLVRQSDMKWAVGSGRSGQIASRVLDGETHQSIASEYGITGERVRQIAEPYLNKQSRETRTEAVARRRHAAAVEDVRTYAEKHPKASIPEIVRATGRRLDAEGVIDALGQEESLRRPMRAATGKPLQFSDKDLIAALRKAATDEKGKRTLPVSANQYAKVHQVDQESRKAGLPPLGPTPQTLILRFGSWRAACEAAGVKCQDRGRTSGWEKGWSDDELREWVARFFREVGPTGTTTAYSKWCKETEGAPSLITLRNRLGRWTDIRAEVASAA